MAESNSPRRLLRSLGALFAGMLAIILLSIGTDVVMHATGALPPLGDPMSDAHAALALGYRLVFGVVGSYIAAKLAPRRPMLHAMILGVVGLVLSTAGAAATWNAGPGFGPTWYPLSLVVTALPTAWLGGRLGAPRHRAT